MIYNERAVLIVYIISALLLSGLIYVIYFMNLGDILHGYDSKGTIAAYYGVNPPKGWAICNGNPRKINGVTIPDLRGKFIFGGNKESQTLLNNVLRNEKLDYEYIQGGSNYSKLTDKVVNIDEYDETFNTFMKGTNVVNHILSNPHMNLAYDIKTEETLYNINFPIVDYLSDEGLDLESFNVNIEKTPEYKEAMRSIYENKSNKKLTDVQVKAEHEQDIVERKKDKYVKQELKEMSDVKLTDEEIESGDYDKKILEKAEKEISMVTVPDYEGYKYPANKSVNADMNLPPYYALIFIIKI